ncbi:MAG: DUF485 domain-containing protein [Solirubrobacteraceae bacterium]|nr:DUF485 domain-containing protein [Solirubrobacteraceae bacterium]
MAVPAGGQVRIDWEAVERAPEFQELVRRRRRFVAPATAFFLVWYLGFIVLAGYAPGFMGESIYEGFTVGYLIALTQFVMVWWLAAWYIRRSDRELDPLRAAAAAQAQRDVDRQRADHAARFSAGEEAGR